MSYDYYRNENRPAKEVLEESIKKIEYHRFDSIASRRHLERIVVAVFFDK